MAKLESILQFLNETFSPEEFPDYPNAFNGLQVEGSREVERIALAVDASEAAVGRAGLERADFLLVHHGLFWDGLAPLVGPRLRKVRALLVGNMSLYSLHLPLDAHPEFGNCVLLLKGLGIEPTGRFAAYQGVDIGWWGQTSLERAGLLERARKLLGGDARVIEGGPEAVRRIGVLTGSGASALAEAAAMGLDTLVTGEAPHHAFHQSMELGVNLLLGGHYATETFGVRALGEELARAFGVEAVFLDLPTGL